MKASTASRCSIGELLTSPPRSPCSSPMASCRRSSTPTCLYGIGGRETFPLRPVLFYRQFYGFSGLLYLIIGMIWVGLCMYHWQNILRVRLAASSRVFFSFTNQTNRCKSTFRQSSFCTCLKTRLRTPTMPAGMMSARIVCGFYL